MRCPFCRHIETRVVDSRETKAGEVTRRRRECASCMARFSTYEEVETFRLSVLKRDGRKEEYNREKLRNGLLRAFEKRPMNEEKLEKFLGNIEYELSVKRRTEIASKEIGKLVMEKLRAIDDVAYIRFASVHKSFGSIKSFEKELEKLK